LKAVIVGGVAGGASCAARLRRLDEHAEIIMVERGPLVSYANCGLPYHVGGVIENEGSLIVSDEQLFRDVFNIDVRTSCEAVGISPKEKTVTLRDVKSGKENTESYDKLVLSPGAASVRPPLPGIDLPGIFHVRTVPDARQIREWIERGSPFLAGMNRYSGFQTVRPKTRAVVVGGGFIGLETAENLVHRGFEVTVLQRTDQVLPHIDQEHARVVEAYLEKHGIRLALDDGVTGFTQASGGCIDVETQSGTTYPADIVILALGVRPDTTLANTAGLEIGERGGIRVDEHMLTSDPDIFAVGDVVEVKDFVTGEWSLIALAGPANRQGRIAADVIAGRDSRFRGSQGTAIIGLFGAAIAWTGASEKALRRLGDTDYEKIYLYPNSHAGYYPGAKPIAMNAGAWRGWRRQADQQSGCPDTDGSHGVRPGGDRTLLRAPIWQRKRSCEFRRNGRRRCSERRHADQPLEYSSRRFPARCARPGGARGGECAGSGQHPTWRAEKPVG
jgi:NADPH-dependent 2,4-dienoyl-CoA reductase/sulfur reductase-like enzyme